MLTNFTLDDSQLKKLAEWYLTLPSSHVEETGAIGGRLTFSFTPTALGVIIEVKDFISKQEINLTDYRW